MDIFEIFNNRKNSAPEPYRAPYPELKLENQLCFPLYAASRRVINLYRPFLKPLGLTYTQYVTMLIFWEKGEASVKELGQRLFLDSGTLTPVLKVLENKDYIVRYRSSGDERVLMCGLTKKGMELMDVARHIPSSVAELINLEPEEGATLYSLLYKILGDN